jgi:hypothetical protein
MVGDGASARERHRDILLAPARRIIEMDDPQFQRELASYNQEQEFLKHLTTLSTGSILLMVTFLEKLFQNPEWKFLVGVSLASFTISIVGCLVTHLQSVYDVEKGSGVPLGQSRFFLIITCLLLALGGFFLGLLALVIFALKNLY